MAREYSDPSHSGSPLLVVDTGSPVASVAVGVPGGHLAVRTIEQRRSSEALLRLIDEAMEEARVALSDLGGLIGLAGPGSFTGLRVGLSTLLGIHQATGLPATTLESLHVLLAAPLSPTPGTGERVLAAIDALRGEWLTSVAIAGGVAAAPRLLRPSELPSFSPCVVSAFDAGSIVAAAGSPQGLTVFEPPELASVALGLAGRRSLAWDAARLTRPLYPRPPAAATVV
jgi:tRNA threonylcarbamoyl adenosine modification protein YeaZ